MRIRPAPEDRAFLGIHGNVTRRQARKVWRTWALLLLSGGAFMTGLMLDSAGDGAFVETAWFALAVLGAVVFVIAFARFAWLIRKHPGWLSMGKSPRWCAECGYPYDEDAKPVQCPECGADLTEPRSLGRGDPRLGKALGVAMMGLTALYVLLFAWWLDANVL